MLASMREARRLVTFVGLPLALIGVIILVYAKPTTPEIKVIGQRVQAFTKLSPYDNRHQIWQEAIREIKAHPITGEGPGSFPIASTRTGSQVTSIQAEHAHDLWLNTAAEQGIPADIFLAAFILALGYVGAKTSAELRRQGRDRDRVIVLGIAAGLVALFGQELVDHTLTNPVVRIGAWGLIGALLAGYSVTIRTPNPPSRP
jgi:putative inorganic carbon (hco3(-)) transporter